jgi:hypothetical protein
MSFYTLINKDRWVSDYEMYAAMREDHWDESQIDRFAECLAGPPGLPDAMLLDMMNDFLDLEKLPFRMLAIDTKRSDDQFYWRVKDIRPEMPFYSYSME